jgi:hypothetical protein
MIVDENVQSLPLDPEADLIGVWGMGAQFERQHAILPSPAAFGTDILFSREPAQQQEASAGQRIQQAL